jgi:hypothetical protein
MRYTDPDFNRVLEVLNQHAARLSPAEAELLNSNTKVFNAAYQEAKKHLGPPPAPPGGFASLPQPYWEKLLAAKESSKGTAFVEPPGGVIPEPDPQSKRKRAIERVRREMREASPAQHARLEEVYTELLFTSNKVRGYDD